MAPLANKQAMSPLELSVRRAVDRVGSFGVYQKVLIALMSLAWILITYSVMINSFVFMNPLFMCGSQELPEPVACLHPRTCRIQNDYTGVYEAGLYCGQKNVRSMIQGAFPIGCLAGVLIGSILADQKGRRACILAAIFSGFVGCLSLIAGISTSSVYLMVFGQLLTGAFSSGASNTSYVITGEVVSSELRQRSIMVYCTVWGATQLTFWPIETYLPSWWVYLFWLNLVPLLVLFVLCYYLVLETPAYYLIGRQDMPSCLRVLRKIGTINKTEESLILEAEDLVMESFYKDNRIKQVRTGHSVWGNIKKIAADPWFRLVIVCMSCIQTGFNTFYYGVLSSLERTGFTFGFNVFLVGLHEFIGYSLAGIYITNLQRKKGLLIVNTATSLIGLSFALPLVRENSLIQSMIISISTLGFVYSYSFSQMINTEAYSVEVQSTAIGISTTLSQIGRSFTPFILNAMNDAGLHPIIAVSFIFLIMGVPPVFFLKETLKMKKDPLGSTGQLSMSETSISMSETSESQRGGRKSQ